MTAPMVYESWGQRVIFGCGTSRSDVAAEVGQLGASRVLLVAAEAELGIARTICADIDLAGVFSDIKPHVPADVAAGVRSAVADRQADLLISVGGGSTTGAAKAAALTTGVPILAVPTTYAGSEATPVWGLTENGHKRTGVDPKVLPKVIVYDAALTLTLPTALSVTSGLNALAHCVDSWWAPRNNPISSALAVEGVRWLASSLPEIVTDGANMAARRDILIGVYLGAVAFAGAGSGLHHKICHVLGGAYNLDHAAMHSVVLPHVVGINLAADPGSAQRLSAGLNASDEPFAALVELYGDVKAPASLGELGLADGDVEQATDLVMEQLPARNPRAVDRQQMSALLHRACRGEPPILVPLDPTVNV